MTQDPLIRDATAAEQALFDRVVAVLRNVPVPTVSNVAVNLIVNAIRESVPTRKEAEEVIDFLFTRAKGVLLDEHYDSVTGRRRSVFPFNQVIHPPFHVEKGNGKG